MERAVNPKSKEFFEKNLKLIDYVINKMSSEDDSMYEYSDLFQEGCYALSLAANTYPGRGRKKFYKYAYDIIYNHIRLYKIKNKSSLSFSLNDKIVDILPLYIRYKDFYNDDELSNILNITMEDIKLFNRFLSPSCSLDMPLTEFYIDSRQLKDTIPDMNSSEFEELIFNNEVRIIIEKELERNDSVTREIYITYLKDYIDGTESIEKVIAKKFDMREKYIHEIITNINNELKRKLAEIL